MSYMVMNELFKDFQQRLNVLDQAIREAALKYAEEFYQKEKCTKEEALEKQK